MTGVEEGKLGTIIEKFYEAAAEPSRWRTVLHQTSLILGAEGAAFIPHATPGLNPVHSEGLDELVDVFVREGWHQRNPRERFALTPSGVITEQDVFKPEEMDTLPFNAEFVRKLGFRSFAGAVVMKTGPGSVSLTFERKLHQHPFSRREVQAFEAILPYLQQAVLFGARLAEARSQGTIDAFEMMNCGGVVLDGLGRALRLNAKAEQLLGTGVQLVQGYLVAEYRAANTSLHRLIGDLLGPRSDLEKRPIGAVALPRRSGRPLVVHGSPIRGAAKDIFQRAKAILMLVDPDEHREPAEPILRQAFGLTPAEARLAIELASGQELREIAAAQHISELTVRTQLRAIFAKTETHRQAELVALLGRMSVGSRPEPR